MYKHQTIISCLGGFIIGFALIEVVYAIHWWALLTLPIFVGLFFLVLIIPTEISDRRAFRKYKRMEKEKKEAKQ